MKISVKTISKYGKEYELILDIDSKHTIYYLISLIHSKCYVSDVPDLAKFTHNEKDLQKSDLNMTIEVFFGNVEATTLMGYYTDGALSPDLLKKHRVPFIKMQRSQKFSQNVGLTFFNSIVNSIIYEYYQDQPYVVVNVPHALNIPVDTIHLGNEYVPKKGTTNLWSLIISFFYQMLNIQLSSVHPGQLIVRGDALLKANNKFISYHEDLETAKAACTKPMLIAQGNYFESLANYNLIFCLDSKRLMRGLYFNIYFPSDGFSEYLEFVNLEYLSLKTKHLGDISARNLQASFANHLLKEFLVDGGLLNSHPEFQGGSAVELQISCPYSDIAMNYFISHQPEPGFWKRGVHTIDDIIKAALEEDGPNRKLILALLKEDSSWLENKEMIEIKCGILDHFYRNISKESQVSVSLG